MSFRHLVEQTLISLDQTANVLLSWLSPWAWRGAWADETLSSRACRAWRDRAPFGRVTMPVIDWLFAWQKLPEGAIGHCHGASAVRNPTVAGATLRAALRFNGGGAFVPGDGGYRHGRLNVRIGLGL